MSSFEKKYTFPRLESQPFGKKFFGDRAFYMMVFSLVIPMMIQNGISTFVNMLDNIMVGRVGTEAMSGVSIANRLFFIFNLTTFGALSGVGIFTAQYFGKGDREGVRMTFRFKLWIVLVLTTVGIIAASIFGEKFIGLFMQGDNDVENAETTLRIGAGYMRILLFSLPAFAISCVYASMLRECGETRVPMYAGIASVLTNLVLNSILIFGLLGAPKLGANGAAIATVIARYVEMCILVIWTHTHKNRQPWIEGAFKTMRVPKNQMIAIAKKGSPLLVNELLWSIGMTFCAQCYSLRGLDVVAAQNISDTVTQFVNIVFMSMGNAVGIIVGQRLGANEFEKAKDYSNKCIAFAMLLSLVSSLALVGLSFVFPKLYETGESVRTLAGQLMLVNAVFAIQSAFLNSTYFVMRCGGKTFITFLFDCGSIWCLDIPVAYVLCHFTSMNIVWVLVCVQLASSMKALFGLILLRKNVWINNITV